MYFYYFGAAMNWWISSRNRTLRFRKSALRAWLIILSAILFTSVANASAKCTFAKVADLPVTMNGLRPMIAVKINGQDARFVLDSGAFYTTISSVAAAQYGLQVHTGPSELDLQTVGGSVHPQIAKAKEFVLGGKVFKDVDLLVVGGDAGDAGNGNAEGGLLGQNFLENFDGEYDLANGALRLFHTEGCDHTVLAYWMTSGQTYSGMPLVHTTPLHPHIVGTASVNGEMIRVELDSGASTSVLTTKAAQRAGINIDSPGVVLAGYSRGVGRGLVKTYIANVASFRIGDTEEIKNTKLRIADINLSNADMLLGADFFISHRIFVGNKEHRLFLSYNGGAVFDLTQEQPIR